VTQAGLDLAVSTVLRLLVLLLSSFLLTMTTSPIKLAAGLEWLLSPLRYLKVPVSQFAMLISVSLRFVPTIIEEAETISRAQRSRGAQLRSRNLLIRLKSATAVLVPLLAVSLQRASDLAVAMESRCYTGGANRSRVDKLCFQRRDRLAIGFVALMFIAALCFPSPSFAAAQAGQAGTIGAGILNSALIR
jgi:energy-coupling factor transport system permease protein